MKHFRFLTTKEVARYDRFRAMCLNIELANRCFGRASSVFAEEEVDFKYRKLFINVDNVKHLHIPRFVHMDLGLVSDALGLAIGHVRGFKRVRRVEGFHELMPVIAIDGLLRIVAAPGAEIPFHKARDILYTLRDKLGMNVKWVSLDSWQSVDTRQILRRRGFITGETSVDRTTVPSSSPVNVCPQIKPKASEGKISNTSIGHHHA